VNSFQTWMRSPFGRLVAVAVLVCYCQAALGVTPARAQTQQTTTQSATPGADYRLGAGDHLFLSVPQRQDLNRELVVDEQGAVTLPLVGKVVVVGLTKAEIETRLLQSLREYYPSIRSVEVSVTRAMSNVIFVSGDVKTPGKYSFTEPINVWEAIREAGGPMPTATLTTVRVIQDRARGGQSFLIDVQAAIDGGSVEKLPMLNAGDTVLIPSQTEVYTGSAGVNIFGAVVRPGAYPLTARQDLMSVLMVAGGPGPTAALGNIKIVRPEPDGTAQTIKINLDKFLDKGDMANNPRLLSGDTVHIGSKTINAVNLGIILGFITAIGTLVLLYYTIQNEVQADQFRTTN
jgi:protein involved in polysaccharide export with SLBB domain